ncbi:MAG: 50S ribosomal protein L29 [Candidatus Altiarchaeota archaeon]|nr:50S ribosomal protein L29 [Candidatus Altiarchaeota archaeon]
MKIAELRKLTKHQLEVKLKEAKLELMKLNAKKALKTIEKPSQVKGTRKLIARIETLLKEKSKAKAAADRVAKGKKKTAPTVKSSKKKVKTAAKPKKKGSVKPKKKKPVKPKKKKKVSAAKKRAVSEKTRTTKKATKVTKAKKAKANKAAKARKK